MGYMKVVIEVTDEDERGMITLSSLQPQVGVELIDRHPTPTQKWVILWSDRCRPVEVGEGPCARPRVGWTIPTADADSVHTYVPLAPDEGYYLRVTATYDDDDDKERTAQAVSTNMVRAEPPDD